MESLGPIEFTLIAGCAIAGAGLIWALSAVITRQAQAIRGDGPVVANPVFLFDGDNLADATLDAQKMIKDAPKHLSDRQAIVALFRDRFPTLDYIMTHLLPGAHEELLAADEATMSLQVEEADGLIRLTLLGAEVSDSQSLGDTVASEGAQRELHFLRDLMDQSPHLVWVQDLDGRMTWANHAYLHLSDRVMGRQTGAGRNWPDRSVFTDLHLDLNKDHPVSRRAKVTNVETGKDHVFDVMSYKRGQEVVHFASDASAAVTAELSKTRAVKTTGRLFGDLSAGVALFDQNRRLAMFNPALTQMTQLQATFLTGRPTLEMFLDALRDNGFMPEPKNYASWKEQFKKVESAAMKGDLCETWDLIDGQTFRVTGRPYDDNAFVFFFEDVSASVSLTRRFKADIETSQGVINAQKHAIAVFSANGSLKYTNKAYQDLWQSGPDNTLQDLQLRNEITRWQESCAAAPSWSELRSYIAGNRRDQRWVDHAILEDGRHVTCEAQPINSLKTLVSFYIEPREKQVNPVIHKLTIPDPGIQSAKR